MASATCLLARQLDALVVDQRRVLDRVGAREDRLLDRLRAVRVRGHLQPCGVRDIHDRRDLVGLHLGLARHAAVGEHGAGGDDLEHIGAAFDRALGTAAELLRPARNTQAHARRNVGLGTPGMIRSPPPPGIVR